MSKDLLKEVQRGLVIIKHWRLIPQKEEATTSKDISEVEVVEKISKVALEEIVKTKIKERLIKINQKAPIKEGTSIISEEERKRLIGRGSNAPIVIELGTFNFYRMYNPNKSHKSSRESVTRRSSCTHG